jgi:ABC-type microcin C transport system duplicated ATPase subunit YejF
VTGSTGSGKSKFLEYLIRQDVENWDLSEHSVHLPTPSISSGPTGTCSSASTCVRKATSPIRSSRQPDRRSRQSAQSSSATAARALELLSLVRIPDPEQRLKAYPHQLSGGQRQRVMIAMALANEPDLLIADEPTTAVDVTVQAQILTLLKDLQARLHMAILLITHDVRIVRKMAGRVYVMYRGEVVESGPVDVVFGQPQHAYTQRLLAAQPKGHSAMAFQALPK